jgi:hypothetical protein
MSKMSELLIAGHSTVRWRTEEGAVGFNFGTLKSASAFENSSTRTKAPLHDTSDKPCRPGALTKNWRRPLRGDRDAVQTSCPAEVEANEWIANDFQEWLERRKKG